MSMDVGKAKYGERFRIYNHYTGADRRLEVKTLCDMFNDIAELHTYQQDCNVDTLNKKGLTWMLRRMHLFIPCMPRWEDKVIVESWNPKMEGLLVPRIYKVSQVSEEQDLYTHSSNSTEVAQGRLHAFAITDWMIINLESRRPERPFPQMYEITGLHDEPLPFTPSLFSRAEGKTGIALTGEPLYQKVFQTRYADIDFNHHVTQSVYIQWMQETHPMTFLQTYRLRELEILYAHEIKPESEIRVEVRQETADRYAYRIASLNGEVSHAWGRCVWESLAEVPSKG